MIEVKIGKNEAGQRFDKYLFKYLNNAPKSFVYKMLRKKNIVLNGKKSDGTEKLNENDIVKLFLADETIEKFRSTSGAVMISSNIPSIRESDIVYEDEDIILINKKAGILSQKANPSDISINEMLISYLIKTGSITKEQLKTFKPAVCNRLDRNTSGLICAGKSLTGLQELSLLFKERSMEKYYYTIVKGNVKKEESISGYLYKDETNNKVHISNTQLENSDYIKTRYIPQKHFKYKNMDMTLLKVELITGKPHQIRAHLASIGFPIGGDTKYGDKKLNDMLNADYKVKHQLLHSYSVTFPKNEEKLHRVADKTFTADIPSVYERIAGGKI